MQTDRDTGREKRHHVLAVQLDNASEALFEVLLQESGRRAEVVVCPRYRHGGRIDVQFQNVSGVGVLDEDRARKNVPAGSPIERLVVHCAGDCAERFRNLIGGNIEPFERGDTGRADRLYRYRIAGLDRLSTPADCGQLGANVVIENSWVGTSVTKLV